MYIGKVMLKIDKDDTSEIICKLAEECGLDENIALELLDSRNDNDNSNRIVDKYQMK